jgi:hypothetical protein
MVSITLEPTYIRIMATPMSEAIDDVVSNISSWRRNSKPEPPPDSQIAWPTA